MRSFISTSFPLIGATAAALMAMHPVTPASATAETTTGAASIPAVAVPTAEPASVPSATIDQPPAAPATAQAQAEPAKPKPQPPSLVAKIHLTSQTMTVQANGRTIHTWKVSSGAPGYATPPGSFKPGWMAKMWRSRQYDDAPMPHSVFFNGGIAVHGTTSIHNLGRAASHGCVRLAPANAARFFQLVNKHGMAHTRIVVHGAQPFKSNSLVAKAARNGRNARGASNWTIVPSQAAAARRTRTDSYGYSPLPKPRRVSQVRGQNQLPYWARY